ncbi:NAD-dependent epimerase/dehydratase family protein, partial [Thermodesulfobacteriota bacterium]
MRSIMITGASGFIGSHIAEHFLNAGIRTNLFVRTRNRMVSDLESRGARVWVSHPSDRDMLRASARHCAAVIHCAGAIRALGWKEYFTANCLFTQKLLSVLDRSQRFVFVSSQAASGPSNNEPPYDELMPATPISDYGKSKLIAERIVNKWG